MPCLASCRRYYLGLVRDLTSVCGNLCVPRRIELVHTRVLEHDSRRDCGCAFSIDDLTCAMLVEDVQLLQSSPGRPRMLAM